MTNTINLKSSETLTLYKVELLNKDGSRLRVSYYFDEAEADNLALRANGLYKVLKTSYNMPVARVLDLVSEGLKAVSRK